MDENIVEQLHWDKKYRPVNLKDYLGDSVRQTIDKFLSNGNATFPNVVLLKGPTGSGKTTMARILMKELLCWNPVDGHSCGECPICKYFDEWIVQNQADGGPDGMVAPGIMEINCSDATGKSAIEEINAESGNPPGWLEGRMMNYRIYVLDECHQLTKAAQNCFLKNLEEPVPTTIYILCTTEPEKLLPTIISRVGVTLEVGKHTRKQLADRLLEISKLEKLKVTAEALDLLVKKCNNIPRSSIKQLETLAGLNAGKLIDTEAVSELLGASSKNETFMEYMKAANSGLEDILTFNIKLKASGKNIRTFMSEFTRYILDCCYIKNGVNLDEYSGDFIKSANDIFKEYRNSNFDLLLQLVEKANSSMRKDDENMNELVLTNTAIQIGKVDFLVEQTLQREASLVEKENKKSIAEYSKQIEEDKEHQFEKLKNSSMELNKETLRQKMGNISVVKDSKNKDNGAVECVNIVNKVDSKHDNNTQVGFMTREEIEKSMNNL